MHSARGSKHACHLPRRVLRLVDVCLFLLQRAVVVERDVHGVRARAELLLLKELRAAAGAQQVQDEHHIRGRDSATAKVHMQGYR